MTGWGLNEEGALEAGVAAMSSILGMQGLPRDQAPVANLMTGIMKAMGSIACLSEASTAIVGATGPPLSNADSAELISTTDMQVPAGEISEVTLIRVPGVRAWQCAADRQITALT